MHYTKMCIKYKYQTVLYCILIINIFSFFPILRHSLINLFYNNKEDYMLQGVCLCFLLVRLFFTFST